MSCINFPKSGESMFVKFKKGLLRDNPEGKKFGFQMSLERFKKLPIAFVKFLKFTFEMGMEIHKNGVYFKMKKGRSNIAYFEHKGSFTQGVGKKARPIKGKEFISINKPQFVWKGTISMIPGFIFTTGNDYFITNTKKRSFEGKMKIKLNDWIQIASLEALESEMLRYLSEVILFPEALLNYKQFKVSHVLDNVFAVEMKIQNMTEEFAVHGYFEIDKEGKVIKFFSKRKFGNDGHYSNWGGFYMQYKENDNGVMVPRRIKAFWDLDNKYMMNEVYEKNVFIYADFVITKYLVSEKAHDQLLKYIK